MADEITITEANYPLWKKGTIISGLLCVAFFGLFWMLKDPFWVSITRLISFVLFALTVMGYLQIMNGPISVLLTTTDKHLIIAYQKNGKTVQEEEFKKNTIKEVFATAKGINVGLRLIKPSLQTFQINFTDTDKELHLFEFSGRPLIFEEKAQGEIVHFFKNIS